MTDCLDGFETTADTVDHLNEQMNEVDATVATPRDHHEAMGDRISDIESEMGSIQTAVSANESFRASVETAIKENEADDTLTDADSTS
ncbi:hypothetical protein [Haladaptatus sp. NG-WS-4]